MRYGNDEVKPDLMNEDAKWQENKMTSRDWDSDKELSFQNACRPERQLYEACLSDNKGNEGLCDQTKEEVESCLRNFGRYFPIGNERMK